MKKKQTKKPAFSLDKPPLERKTKLKSVTDPASPLEPLTGPKPSPGPVTQPHQSKNSPSPSRPSRPSGPAPPPSCPAPPAITLDPVQLSLFEDIEKGGLNYFIQGQAGTGKSTFVKYFKSNTKKRYCVVCPTGIAAINIGGTTIHSLFQLPTNDILELTQLKLATRTQSILSRIGVLIIDEVSMVRPDILDAIDLLAKQSRSNSLAFGGLQMILIGDLAQLPPVIGNETKEIFKLKYGFREPYFFDSESYKNGKFNKLEFTNIYRQIDRELMIKLSNIRSNIDVRQTIEYFNETKFTDPKFFDQAVTLTPYRKKAENINNNKLDKIPAPPRTYAATVEGKFDPEKEASSPQWLTLKVGALVMFTRTYDSNCINGTAAFVESLDDDQITVRLVTTNNIVIVQRTVWQKLTYQYDITTKLIEEKVIGSFTQFPLLLCYAMTVHKSQGRTLDKVILEIDRGAFSHGQLYVALSRTRSRADMHLNTPLKISDAITDKRVTDFLKSC
ncbi:MAG: AAA family ATPase [Deltaproteobacteria bacterium]|nr:AAA family ATPase [Deltaproteobacteria bacterium]